MHCNVSILRRLNGVTEKLDCPWLLGRRDCIIGAKRCQESLLEVGEERIQGTFFFLQNKSTIDMYIYLIWLTQKQPQDVKSFSSHSAKQDSENQRTNATSAKNSSFGTKDNIVTIQTLANYNFCEFSIMSTEIRYVMSPMSVRSLTLLRVSEDPSHYTLIIKLNN